MMDYAYYQRQDNYIKADPLVHSAAHYTYPPIQQQHQVQLPLSPQSIHHNPLTTRTSLSDIDEMLESSLLSPTLDSHADRDSQSPFNIRIPHPELLPDSGAQVARPQASYCLSDFVVQRTLGTGSFGRVHLGASSLISSYSSLNLVQSGARTIRDFTPLKSSQRRRSSIRNKLNTRNPNEHYYLL